MKAIYVIESFISKKRYIGSAIDFEKRKKEHLTKLKNNTHPNYLIQRDFNINPSSVTISILDERNDLNRSQLYDLEQAYINAEKIKYNLSKFTSSENSEGRIVNRDARRKAQSWRSKYKSTINKY